MEEFKRIDQSKWQKTDAEEGKSPTHRLTLPPLTDGDKKKKGEKNKPETASSQGKSTSVTQRKLALQKAELAKTLEEIKVLTNLTHVKKNAMEELRQHSVHLAETNCRLIEHIQHTDDSTAKQARALLLQHEALQRRKATVRTCNQNQLDTARAELQELEKTMEKNLGNLQQQLDEVTSKVQALQDELVVLRSYIDGQHPEPAVRIVRLQHSIQSLKQQQQEELDKTEQMEKASWEELQEKTRAKREALLEKVVEEMLLHQDGLKQMVLNNHVLRREILRQREIIKDQEEEIGELKRSIQKLCQSTRDPRELMFADVLLCRPKRITTREVNPPSVDGEKALPAPSWEHRALLSSPRTDPDQPSPWAAACQQPAVTSYLPSQPWCTPDTQVVLSIPAKETPLTPCSATLRSQPPGPAPSPGGLR